MDSAQAQFKGLGGSSDRSGGASGSWGPTAAESAHQEVAALDALFPKLQQEQTLDENLAKARKALADARANSPDDVGAAERDVAEAERAKAELAKSMGGGAGEAQADKIIALQKQTNDAVIAAQEQLNANRYAPRRGIARAIHRTGRGERETKIRRRSARPSGQKKQQKS